MEKEEEAEEKEDEEDYLELSRKKVESLEKDKEYEWRVSRLFCIAAKNGQLKTMKYLCTILSVEKFKKFGKVKGEHHPLKWSAIHYACQSKSIEVVEYLLSLGYDLNERIADYVEEEEEEKKDHKRKKPKKKVQADKEDRHRNAFFLALELNSPIEFIEYLISKGSKRILQQKVSGLNPFFFALKYPFGKKFDVEYKLQVLKLLVNGGVEHNRGKHNAIDFFFNAFKFKKIKGDSLDLFKYLLSLNIELKGENILKTQNLEILKLFQSQNCDMNYKNGKGENLFIESVKHRKLELIKYCISQNIDINCTTPNNKNALFYLVENRLDTFDLLKYLFEVGVNPTLIKKSGKDLFLASLHYKSLETLKLVYSFSPNTFCNYNLTSGKQHSPFHFYIHENTADPMNVDIFRFLIENNIDNEFDGSRYFILHQLVNSVFISGPANLKELYQRFKLCFEYFLKRGHPINEIEPKTKSNPIQHIINNHELTEKCISPSIFAIFKYLIEKGSDLLHRSEEGSLLHSILMLTNILYPSTKKKINQKYDKSNRELYKTCVYILLRSLEYNNISDQNVVPKIIYSNDDKVGSKRKYDLNDAEISTCNKLSKQEIYYQDVGITKQKQISKCWKDEFANRVLVSEFPILKMLDSSGRKISFTGGHFFLASVQ